MYTPAFVPVSMGMLALQLEPALEALEAVMDNLKRVLDSRVYVALGRGLLDCP